MTVNRQIVLARRPRGWPTEADFALIEGPVPAPGPGQFLARTLWLSVDPYMRGRMSDRKSYAPPVQLGEVMVGGAVAQVQASGHPWYRPGDLVCGPLGWQEYALSDGRGITRVDPELAPPATALGVLGMPGLTAYFGLLEIGRPRHGETVFISGAAGAVGSVAGQIARLHGCRVVGSAGSDEKVAWLTGDLGFDAAFNYKTAGDCGTKLRELCPQGIDVYFDNVGGTLTDAVFQYLNPRARVAICGQISQYNLEQPELGPRLLWLYITKQLTVQGFLVSQFADRYQAGLEQMARWLREGRLKYRETVVTGLERAPQAFIAMLRGENTGKMLVRVWEPQ